MHPGREINPANFVSINEMRRHSRYPSLFIGRQVVELGLGRSVQVLTPLRL